MCKTCKLEYYDVNSRILRMNKRVQIETGELLFEKLGHKWALIRLAFEIYGALQRYTDLRLKVAKPPSFSSRKSGE